MTLNDFTILTNKEGDEYIDWDEIEMKLEKEEYWKFRRWMSGQGCVPEGVFTPDLERFLNGDFEFGL